ncbi:MAG: transporter permease [Microbacterium sp.]|jgi:ABC-type nitrate/sulfonate/bicarbonate transport system substrate-binding protein|nr:transporter permease [Microbacterium sp.]
MPALTSFLATALPRRSSLITGAALVTASAFVLSGCSASSDTANSGDPELTTVKFALSYLPDVYLNGLAYADQAGLFKEAGIEIEYVPWGTTVTSDSVVAGGEADLGISTDVRMALLAMASGMEITSLAAVYQHTPYVLTALADNGYDRPADLAGEVYGGFGSPMEVAVVNDMITNDGGSAPAEEVTLSVAAYEALPAERVDAILSFPGEIFVFDQNGTDVTTWDTTDFGVPDAYATLLIGNNDFIVENEDLVADFVAAFQEGYESALEDPDAANEAFVAEFPDATPAQDQIDFVSDMQNDHLYVSPDGVFGSQTAEVWQTNADWLIERGILAGPTGEKLTEFDASTVFTNDFLK